MDLASLQAFIRQTYLSEDADVQLEASTDLLEARIIDSIGIMRLIAFIEQDAQIKVPLGDLKKENFKSMEMIMEYVRSAKLS